jgi:enoyl-CoA hydratase/carnithine racemase
MANGSSVAYETILYEVDDPIATVTLNRPDRLNAWTDRMGAEVTESDPEAAVIVITGAGRGFCAGADMQRLQSISEGAGGHEDVSALDADPGDPEMEAGFRGTYTYLLSIRKPIIAAINGPCAGMAIPIALACDLRFASDRAVFTTAFSRRGLVAEWGIGWLLPRLVGTAHALDLLLSARKIDAAEAERIGLVNKVVPGDELRHHVEEYARDMAAHCSPTSMRIMKRQIYEGLQEDFGPSHEKAVRLMLESFERPDFAEGVNSYLEKRPPKFKRV